MKKNNFSESGALNLRILATFVLCAAAVSLTVFSFAAPAPSAGTLSTSHRQLTFADTSPIVPNPTGEGIGFSKPTCTVPNTCSTYTLTLDPSLFAAAGSYDPAKNNVVIQISWPTSAAQFGSFVEDKTGKVIATNTAGIDPVTITIPVVTPGLSTGGPYTIITTAEIGSDTALNGTVSLVETSGAGEACVGCTAPRYQMIEAPSGTASQSGEPSIGVDWNPNLASLKQIGPGNAAHGPTKLNTGGITLFTATFDQYRVSFNDCSSPARVDWTDIAFATQQITTLDAIGFTDHYTSAALGTGPYRAGSPATPGRTFHGQLSGGDSLTSYTDDDGNSHTPSQGGGVPQGPDHETIGAGPYAPTNPTAVPPVVEPAHPTYQNAVYYCTQNVAPEAECSRSDDGGLTFGPAVPIYTPTQCTGSIHGHVKVARDGTVYVPNYSCTLPTGNQGVAVSSDNGITWTERNVPGSGSPKPGLVDPSVAVALNDVGKPTGQKTNTIYFGYIDSDGTAKVTASADHGLHWAAPQNVGAAFNIVNATFPVVVAGDDNRAAFGFLGTSTPGDSSTNANFPGVWHLYIATTYNGGKSWITIDATPDDPVQVGPVCNGGTLCSTKRNLLDFNGFDVDSEGRGLLGLSDGCVNCSNTSSSADSNAAQGLIARQSGGPRLFAAFDPPLEAAPAAPQVLSAIAETGGVLVSWLEPDNGGDPITSYKIYRSTTSGKETLLATVANDALHKQTKYLDTTANGAPNYFYHVTAVNSKGESAFCEEVSLVAAVGAGNACSLPYVTVNGPGTKAAESTSEQQIQNVNIGEPFTTCTDNSITFVMKVPTLDPGVAAGGPPTGQAVPPPNTEYQIVWNVTDTSGNPETIYVEMDTNCPIGNSEVPEFTYGRRDPGATGSFDQGECTAQPGDPLQTCPAISGSYTADGVITIKLDVSRPLSFSANTGAASGKGQAFTWDGHAPGTKLGSVSSEITLFAGCGAGFLETLSSSSGSAYTRLGNLSCSGFAPIAQLSGDPVNGEPPLTVNFDASGSKEPAGACGTITSYKLDFGDGSAAVTQGAANPKFSQTYTQNGVYPATLTVTDSAGETNTNVAQVVVTVASNTPPTAVLKTTPTSGTAPLTVTLDGNGSSDPDFSDTIQDWTFSFGDGSPDVSGAHPKVTHTYSKAGSFTARLIVTDSRGAKSQNTAQQVITVSASSTPTPTPGGTVTPTPTPGGTATPTPTPGATVTPTPTPGGTVTPTPTPGGTVTPTPTPGGTATPTPTPGGTATPSPTPSASPTPTPQPTPANVELLNISGRVFTQGADNVGIGGFIIKGSGTVRVMARGIGPSLKVDGKPVQGRLENPVLELHDSDGHVLSNDDWRSTQEAEIQDTGLAPSDDKESAIVKRLPAGKYTAVIRGANNSSGIGLVELYDLDSTDPGELGNLSVRALVQTDDDVLIDGVILRGGQPKRVVFRAIGPDLHNRGVQGELQDPTLDVYDQNGTLLRTNDNWKDAPNAAEIQSAGLAPKYDRESAILLTLPSGNYTSIVRGVNRTTGIALAEAFKLD